MGFIHHRKQNTRSALVSAPFLFLAFLPILFLPNTASAEQDLYKQKGDPSQAKQIIAKIEGVYKRQFQNSDVDDRKYQSKNTLVIKRASNDAIDFDARLVFFNGHECSINGVAEYRQVGGFVFEYEDEPDKNEPYPNLAAYNREQSKCIFIISLNGDVIHFADPSGNCKMNFCGMRGGLDGDQFTLKEKRKLPK